MDEVLIEQSGESLTRSRWLVALREVVALFFGALTIYRPGATLAALILLFGLLLVMFPGAGALTVTLWIGAYAIVVGIVRIGQT